MPTPQRLPIVNNDDGVWGDILRQYILKEHYDDGTDNAVNGGHKTITIRAGTTAAGTAPLKFTSGPVMTVPEPGTMEYTGDMLHFTITTGSTRKKVALYDDSSGATGDLYYRDSSGVFTRLGIGSTNQVLKVSSGLPSWGASPALFVWNEVTGTSQTAAVNNGYIANNASLVTITLPATAAVGDVIEISGKGAGGWKVAQNASGIIHFGMWDTTTGTGGYIASTQRRDAVRLVCVVANNEWNVAPGAIGNIEII